MWLTSTLLSGTINTALSLSCGWQCHMGWWFICLDDADSGLWQPIISSADSDSVFFDRLIEAVKQQGSVGTTDIQMVHCTDRQHLFDTDSK